MTVRSLGVLSTAHEHCNSYAAAIETIDGAEIVCVADEDPERGQAFADRHRIEYLPVEDALSRIDAAIVCAPNADHGEWVTEAAAAGVDVLCEKPLASTVKDAREIVEACEDITLGVAMPIRFSDPAVQAKKVIEDGAIGELQTIVGTNLLKKMTAGWFVDPELSGGGAIMDHTVHVLDLVRWMTGEEVTEVYAETGTRFSDIPVEDIDVLSMELTDGTAVTHDGSWRQPEEWDTWGDVTLRLIGTEGVLTVDCFDQTIDLTRDSGEPGRNAVFWGSDANAGLLRDFLDALREDREPEIPGDEGLAEMRVVEAAYESAETGEAITIE